MRVHFSGIYQTLIALCLPMAFSACSSGGGSASASAIIVSLARRRERWFDSFGHNYNLFSECEWFDFSASWVDDFGREREVRFEHSATSKSRGNYYLGGNYHEER